MEENKVVTAHFRELPRIRSSLSEFSAACSPGGSPSSRSFEVWNGGADTLTYSITTDAAWLSCYPAEGTSTGERDGISLVFDASGLAEGEYTAVITVAAEGSWNSPARIIARLSVTTRTRLAVSPSSLLGGGLRGTDAPPMQFEVWNSGVGTLNYGISTASDWLTCFPTSGQSTGEHDVVTVSFHTAGFASGVLAGQVTVTGTVDTYPLWFQAVDSPTVVSMTLFIGPFYE